MMVLSSFYLKRSVFGITLYMGLCTNLARGKNHVFNLYMAGRPKIVNHTTLGKLREAFLWGCTDREACLYAGINPDTLYEYQKKNPKYTEQKDLYKSNPVLIARKSVIYALASDPHLALKYLERKKSDEFSLKQTVDAIVSESDRVIGFNYIIPKDRIEYP